MSEADGETEHALQEHQPETRQTGEGHLRDSGGPAVAIPHIHFNSMSVIDLHATFISLHSLHSLRDL